MSPRSSLIKMAGILRSGEGSEPSNWQLFFEAAVGILDECEALWETSDRDCREAVQIRLEYVIQAFQTILPFLSETRMVMGEIVRNFHQLHRQWIVSNPSTCTDLALYSLVGPKVERNGDIGRPRLDIPEEVLLDLRSLGLCWTEIARMLLVSRWTLRRRVVEHGLQEVTGFSPLSDEELDNTVRQFMRTHGNLVGYSLMSGHLRSLGLRVQRDRIRASIARVDPENSRIRWAVVVSRRAYSVPGPNSLWHIDGHHSLVSWGFVIHGGIDGFSRLIVFLKCSTNNRSETVRQVFLSATQNYEWPSRVRTDYGGENVLVWALMEDVRGTNRGSYIAGTSTQNQQIERLWRDVFRAVTHMFYYTFQSMEEAGILDRNNDIHLFTLQFIFLPRINRALESFTSAWNFHPVRTERNWTPMRMWSNGMIDHRNRDLNSVAIVAESAVSNDDLEWYGYDPQAPHPGDDGLSSVNVDDVAIDITQDVLEQLQHEVDPLQESKFLWG